MHQFHDALVSFAERREIIMKKQMLAVILSTAMILGLTACGGTTVKNTDTAAANVETYTIGISQFAEHGSLDN